MHLTSLEQPKSVLGLMSGTSLDGLDLAYCRFQCTSTGYSGEIIDGETVSYPDALRSELETVFEGSALELAELHVKRSLFVSEAVRSFLERHQLEDPIAIADHGQTIFHNPNSGYTTQIGSGAVTASKTGIPVITDFRQQDVALGGQGAPLVPIGDHFLFADYDACVNLGGFANISHLSSDVRVGYDVTVCNMALNELALQLDHPYDAGGRLAAAGNVNQEVLDALNNLPFFESQGPKSLGREWYTQDVKPLLNELNIQDALATCCEHTAIKIAECLENNGIESALITGGGAFNSHLIQRIRHHGSGRQFAIPDNNMIELKEAYIFAFMGARFLEGKPNVFASVTGAQHDHRAGCIYLP